MTFFAKILVANRGEIAWRVMRTAKAMGYHTVAVYSDADKDAPHVAFADEAVRIGPPPVGESYLSIDRVLDAARTSGADAIHPGYGFLSENETFAAACEKMGLVFIGPPPPAIAAMGNKAAAKRRMIDAGVACVPGYQGAGQTDANLESEARKIGFPVMVKAAAGGGGRGMRLVERDGDLLEALRTARTEAEGAFGSGELILEKAVVDARHVEIQVFADSHGNVIHLGERDCSVQRRHQKVIEEAPSPAVDEKLRDRMGNAAVAAAKAIGYRGAGTVEFLLGNDGAFYFLEMNTRLQVEHPVTEAVTGLDLVEWQLRVARGEALPLAQDQVHLTGHAIELRLYAEDPYAGFLPQMGRIEAWRAPTGAGVRTDHGMRDGLVISPFYDPMIAKLIAHGVTREQARVRLIQALRDTVVLGPTTNRHFLLRLLEHPDFAAGKATTAFLGTHSFAAPAVNEDHWRLAASLLWRHSAERYPAALRGWRNSNPEPTPIKLAVGTTERVLHVAPQDAVATRAPFHIDGNDIIVDLDGHAVRFEDRTYLPPASAAASGDGKVRAPMDGRIVSVMVDAGQKVVRGQTLIVLEAMKIQHQLKAALDATIESIDVREGQQVSNRAVLMTMASDD
ncbi:acetyl-CoA carboxylase biotin carboxylase subunit [Reyranella sp.]|jgi:geranyl-CoA carboxylase alpha subunit|uniref:acetyl-CoA carboxylase biotin carboxylase subunit n=1 Tax=Reyranella sp. TaxID=1929291 RepID=UPI002F93BC47